MNDIDKMDNNVMVDVVKTEKKDKLSDSFYLKGEAKKVEEKLSKTSGTEFTTKGTNRRFTEKYDIHFMVGSELFKNIVEFLNEFGYDVIMRFRKKEVMFFILDLSHTHATQIVFDKIEFADYTMSGLDGLGDEGLDAEKVIYIDTSILDDMNINGDYPIDFYVDTIEMKRFYIVNAKERVDKRLNSMADEFNATITSYKDFEHGLKNWLSDKNYQKLVVNYSPFKNLMISLTKKKSKKKDETILTSVYIKKNELDFRVENEIKLSSVVLSGEDLMVYPLNEDFMELNLQFFTKFSKLKLVNQVAMYVCGNKMPVILETRLGGGKIIVWFTLAPRVEGSD